MREGMTDGLKIQERLICNVEIERGKFKLANIDRQPHMDRKTFYI